jgi:hypothetical protein
LNGYVLAIGLFGFSAMAALIARLCLASVGTAVSVAACVHGIGIVVACSPLSVLLPVPLALALVFSDVRRFLWGQEQRAIPAAKGQAVDMRHEANPRPADQDKESVNSIMGRDL